MSECLLGTAGIIVPEKYSQLSNLVFKKGSSFRAVFGPVKIVQGNDFVFR